MGISRCRAWRRVSEAWRVSGAAEGHLRSEEADLVFCDSNCVFRLRNRVFCVSLRRVAGRELVALRVVNSLLQFPGPAGGMVVESCVKLDAFWKRRDFAFTERVYGLFLTSPVNGAHVERQDIAGTSCARRAASEQLVDSATLRSLT